MSHEHQEHHHHDDGRGHAHHDHGPAMWRRFSGWFYPLLYRNPPSNRVIVELAELGPEDRVLDVGCGPGAAVRAAAAEAAHATGIDPSDRMLKFARRRSSRLSNVDYLMGAAHQIPTPDAAFTAAWTVHAMHHWADAAAGLTEIHRVLEPGGRLLVMEVLDPDKPWGIDRAGMEEIAATLESAGFEDVTTSVHRVGRTDDAVISGTKPA